MREEIAKARHLSAVQPSDADTDYIRRIAQHELTSTAPSGSTLRSDYLFSNSKDNYFQPSNFNIMSTTASHTLQASVTRAPGRISDNAWGRDQPSRGNSCNFGTGRHVIIVAYLDTCFASVADNVSSEESIVNVRTWNHQILNTEGLPVNPIPVVDLHLPSSAHRRRSSSPLVSGSGRWNKNEEN